MEDVTLLHKQYALETSVTRPRYTARQTQWSTTPWCLFNSSTKKAGCIDIALGHLPLEVTSKRFSEEETLLDCWDKSWIQGFGNAYGIRIMAKLGGVTHQAKPSEKPRGMKKNRTALGRLGLIVQPDGIRLDGLT